MPLRRGLLEKLAHSLVDHFLVCFHSEDRLPHAILHRVHQQEAFLLTEMEGWLISLDWNLGYHEKKNNMLLIKAKMQYFSDVFLEISLAFLQLK
jgi:hypothetical protein